MKDCQESAPALCTGCNAFFGSHATQGFCSACWKARQAEMSTAPAPSPAPAPPAASEPAPPPAVPVEVAADPAPRAEAEAAPAEPAAPAAAPQSDAPSTSADAAAADRPPQPPGRCFECRKKVGLASGFKCRCEYVFCAAHRLPECHACVFDHRGTGKAALAAANPVVKADKLAKI